MIFLDEIDGMLKLPYSDDFFVAIRGMYNERPEEPAFRDITFCLFGEATPNELIKDRRTTPYNVGRTIELRDFDPEHDNLDPLYPRWTLITPKPAKQWCARSYAGQVGTHT